MVRLERTMYFVTQLSNSSCTSIVMLIYIFTYVNCCSCVDHRDHLDQTTHTEHSTTMQCICTVEFCACSPSCLVFTPS